MTAYISALYALHENIVEECTNKVAESFHTTAPVIHGILRRSDFQPSENQVLNYIYPNVKISKRTQFLFGHLLKLVRERNLIMMTTANDGTCFYDAFAKSLSEIRSQNYTAQTMMDKVAEAALSWEYQDFILPRLIWTEYENTPGKWSFDVRRGKAWGTPTLDGAILAGEYNVNLKMIGVGLLGDSRDLIDENVYIDIDTVVPCYTVITATRAVRECSDTIYMANISDHFIALFERRNSKE